MARKLSLYNKFVSAYKKKYPSSDFKEIAKAWAKEKASCPTCYAPVESNPSKKPSKSKSKKPSSRTPVLTPVSTVLPFVGGVAVGGGVGFGSRYIDYELPLPAPFNAPCILIPSATAVVGGLIALLTDHKALGVSIGIGSFAVLIYNYYISPVLPSALVRRRRLIASQQIPIRRKPRLVAQAPVSVAKPMLIGGRPGVNGSDQRPAKLGLPSEPSSYGDVPIQKAGFLHPAKLGCDGNSRPSNLPVRFADRRDRKEVTPTFIGGETILS